MRYDILETIKAEEGETLDNLGQLFNAYMGRLSMLESSASPRYNMREFARLWAANPVPKHKKREREQAQHLASFIPQFYHLQILSNSLHDLHRYVNGAIKHLEAFFADYGGDLKRYAIENRLRVIAEYGSEDESDWQEDGLDEQGEPKWKPTYKEDAEALKNYTLAADLQQFFEGADWRGEHLGSSGPEDFALFTRIVSTSSGFNPFKMFAAFTGSELPIYRKNEAGEMVPQTLAEQAENEVNDELRDVRVACYFDQILRGCCAASVLFQGSKISEDPGDYRLLLERVVAIRDCAGLLEPEKPFND